MQFKHSSTGTDSLFKLLVYIFLTKPGLSFYEDQSFILKVCQETIGISYQSSFFVTNLNPDFSSNKFIRLLHDNYIPTVVNNLNGINARNLITNKRSNNMLIILNDVRDILSLVLDSVSQTRANGPNQEDYVSQNWIGTAREILGPNQQIIHLPRYCFNYETSNTTIGDANHNEKCDFVINVGEKYLQSRLELPDSLFQHTRKLFQHRIWNDGNYLIFAVRKYKEQSFTTWKNISLSKHARFPGYIKHDASYDSRDLLFTFKFIWRFFRGHKAVICLGERCYRYDPFQEKVFVYDTMSKSYFDFSWSSMNQKTLSLFFYEEYFLFDYYIGWKFWSESMFQLVSVIEKRLNCSCIPNFSKNQIQGSVKDGFNQLDVGLRYNTDLFLFDGGLRDYSFDNYEFFSFEFGKLCFVVPRAGFMPQYLVPSMCFTSNTWIYLILTYSLFVSLHYFYKHLQLKTFASLYSAKDLNDYEHLSTFLSMYSYTLAVGQPRLLLGKLITGKLLFLIFVISTMIFSTVFQSAMVTSLSNRLRYANIDSIKELENSNLLIQSADFDFDFGFYTSNLEYKLEKDRLINSFQFHTNQITEVFNARDILIDYHNGGLKYTSKWNVSESVVNDAFKAMNIILERDVFLLYIPYELLQYENLIVTHPFSSTKFSFHRLKECVMSYPNTFHMLRNSIYGDKIIDILNRLFEAGHLKQLYKNTLDYNVNFKSQVEEDAADRLRPFSSVDLHVAFMSLIFGLILSTFAFYGEYLYSSFFN